MNNRSLFPSLKSWIFAIKLAIPAYLGATVVFGFEFWRYSAFAVILAINGNEGLSFCLAISMIALLLQPIEELRGTIAAFAKPV